MKTYSWSFFLTCVGISLRHVARSNPMVGTEPDVMEIDVDFAADSFLKKKVASYENFKDMYIANGCDLSWGEFPSETDAESFGTDEFIVSRRSRRTQETKEEGGLMCTCGMLHDMGIHISLQIGQAKNGLPVAGYGLIGQSARGKTQESFPCENGQADGFKCKNVDLIAHIPLDSVETNKGRNPQNGNDIWGWTGPNGEEIVIWGVYEGTYFYELNGTSDPLLLGFLPTSFGKYGFAPHRDMKVVGNFVYIGAENTRQGMQIYDLRQLLVRPVNCDNDMYCKVLKVSALYTGIKNSHNIVANVDNPNHIYVVGSNECLGGLHIVDISDPLKPSFEACFSEDGYVHDAHCVYYDGPDQEHKGKEICACFNEDTVTIVDVTDKANMQMLSRKAYANAAYTHQGVFSPDHSHIVFGDESDEQRLSTKTRTLVLDVSDLENPTNFQVFSGRTNAIDHNLYIRQVDGVDFMFQSNYVSGLQIFRVDDYGTAAFEEIGFFDTEPPYNAAVFLGAWSVYPFFSSGMVALSSYNSGLFILKPKDSLFGPTDAPSESPTQPTNTPSESPSESPPSASPIANTNTPSESPTVDECMDNKLLNYKNKGNVCEWVGKVIEGKEGKTRRRTRKRCKKRWAEQGNKKLRAFCPATCGKVGMGRCKNKFS